jgi:hypothetical protein
MASIYAGLTKPTLLPLVRCSAQECPRRCGINWGIVVVKSGLEIGGHRLS